MPRSPPSDHLPTPKTLTAALSYPLLDSAGSTTTLSAALPPNPHVLVIFIRNFLCGNCQQYLITLSSLLPPSSLPSDLSVVVVGCGAASLIPSYNDIVQCPYPIFTDPTGKLYEVLGCHKTLSLGSRSPEYIQRNLVVGAIRSVVQGLRRVGSGDVLSAGDMSVNGGEFLFMRDRERILVERVVEKGEQLPQEQQTVEEGSWKVGWCHRMRNTRDHTEVEDVKVVLGLTPATGRESEELNEKQPEVQPIMRRATTTKLHRAMSKRSQSFMSTLTRSHTMRSGAGVESRLKMARFHSYSASVQVVSAS